MVPARRDEMAASQIKQVNLDMSYKGLFKGDYIAAAEFGGREPTFRIAHVQFERLPSLGKGDTDGAEAQEKDRAVVYFDGFDRGWVLNRTNAECLGAMFGSVLRDWIGKRVTLVAEQVRVGPKTELGIRVKGSPDMAQATIKAKIELPRKKPIWRDLVRTAGQSSPASASPQTGPEPAPVPREPGSDDE
jgi:hypothetical protein